MYKVKELQHTISKNTCLQKDACPYLISPMWEKCDSINHDLNSLVFEPLHRNHRLLKNYVDLIVSSRSGDTKKQNEQLETTNFPNNVPQKTKKHLLDKPTKNINEGFIHSQVTILEVVWTSISIRSMGLVYTYIYHIKINHAWIGKYTMYGSSWWFFTNPIWNILQKSNWIISPGIGVKIEKIFELPPPRWGLIIRA